MGYIDSLGRFIRDPDVDSIDSLSSTSRKTSFALLQFITQFIRNEQDELVNSLIPSFSMFVFRYRTEYLHGFYSSKERLICWHSNVPEQLGMGVNGKDL